MRTLILIPTYNEHETIAETIRAVCAAAPDALIRVIDDSSPDNTAIVVRELQKNFPQLTLYEREKKSGLGAAYIDALTHITQHELGDFDAIITMDADGSHSAGALPSMRAALAHADLVIGSRYVRGGSVTSWNAWRRLLSRSANVYARLITGVPAHDLTAGFVALRAPLLAKINLHELSAVGYFYQVEFKFLCARAGAHITEVPIIFRERAQGVSKMSGHIAREGLMRGARLLVQRLKTRST